MTTLVLDYTKVCMSLASMQDAYASHAPHYGYTGTMSNNISEEKEDQRNYSVTSSQVGICSKIRDAYFRSQKKTFESPAKIL